MGDKLSGMNCQNWMRIFNIFSLPKWLAHFRDEAKYNNDNSATTGGGNLGDAGLAIGGATRVTCCTAVFVKFFCYSIDRTMEIKVHAIKFLKLLIISSAAYTHTHSEYVGILSHFNVWAHCERTCVSALWTNSRVLYVFLSSRIHSAAVRQ